MNAILFMVLAALSAKWFTINLSVLVTPSLFTAFANLSFWSGLEPSLNPTFCSNSVQNPPEPLVVPVFALLVNAFALSLISLSTVSSDSFSCPTIFLYLAKPTSSPTLNVPSLPPRTGITLPLYLLNNLENHLSKVGYP
jgi:hypothetical protein